MLGIAMFMFGVSMFTYHGRPLNPIVSKAGEYSFAFWLPTIITGISLLFVKKKKAVK
jgi:hypothetical protein